MNEAQMCERCGNRLALGMSIVEITDIVTAKRIMLCGSCTEDFVRWVDVYADHMQRLRASGG